MFKVATWNVNSLRIRLPVVLDWLNKHQPDVLALQETKLQDKDFPVTEITAAGYHVVYAGQKTYNGMAILSKKPCDEASIVTELLDFEHPDRRLLEATYHGIRFLNLYIPNGNSIDSDKYIYKLNWLAKLTEHVSAVLKQYPRVVLLGDFNIAPEDRDVHDPKAWEGHVLVSGPERKALDQLLRLGLHDIFHAFEQPPKSYSWWDYRMLGFRRNHGLRIDLILTNDALVPHCTACTIDKEPRRLERPSDHTPVIAEFDV